MVVRREVELGSRSHRAQRGHRIGEAEVRFGSKADNLPMGIWRPLIAEKRTSINTFKSKPAIS